jgi:hypothetical protein
MPAKKSLILMEQALETVIEQIEQNPDPLAFPINSARIDYLPAMLVRPDPVQARRVLPEAIHYSFHAGQLTPVQALQELVRLAQLAARQHGRPFTNVIDLLADLNGGNEAEDDRNAPKYTPEELLVRDLVLLAVTLRDDGQVNPLTVIDVSQGVTRLFRIETGERRYWANWLLQEFLPGYTGDGSIPCVIIHNTQVSVFRQARENTARVGLSAIAIARQAALLLMAVHDIPKPDCAVNNDFYRQALDLDLRDKREYTDVILTAMGGINRSQLSRYKALLHLSDEAIELADRHGLDEGRLRFVLKLAEEDQAEMIRQIVQLNLNVKQIQAICEQPTQPDSHESDLPKEALRLAGLAKSAAHLSGQGFAEALFQQESDWNLALARVQILKRVVLEAETFITQQ